MTAEQWNAVKTSDRSYDGKFFYGLRTTKKFCRPSCPKRCYDPRKVVIFDTLEEALASGFRPCGRCRPDRPEWTDTKTELAHAARHWIDERYTEKFSLDELADALHVNKSYLLRSFKTVTGTTPLEYHNHVRCECARQMLTSAEKPVAQIAAEVGYVSASHFTQVFRKVFGCTPSAYREAYFQGLDCLNPPHKI